MKRLVAWLSPPVFDSDPFKTQVARLIHFLCLFGCACSIVITPFLNIPTYKGGDFDAFVYLTLTGGGITLILNKRGHTQWAAGVALGMVSLEIMYDNFRSLKWISPAQILSVAVILLFGIGFGRRGFIGAMAFNMIGLVLALIYRLNHLSLNNDATTLIVDYLVQIGLHAVIGINLWIPSQLILNLYRKNQQMTTELADRNKALEHEVAERQQANEQSERIAHTSREIIDITHELLDCESMDTLWRRAVELARERLDVERCSIYLFDYEHKVLRGTFGTNLQRQTTEEQNIAFPVAQIEWPNPQKAPHDVDADWRVRLEVDLMEYHEAATPRSIIAKGWNGEVAIRPRKGQILGIFYCDAAISGKAHDPAHLDLIALYCSLLGSIAERKQLTTNLNDRTRELTHMLDISRSMSSTLELKPLLNQIAVALKDVAGGDTATIAEFINDRYDCRILSTTEPHNQHLVGQTVFYDSQVDVHLHYIVTQHEPLIIANLQSQSVYAKAFVAHLKRVNPKVVDQTGTVMAIPLIIRERAIGLCLIGASAPYVFSEYGATLAFGVANQTAALIELVRTHEAEIKAAAKSERSRLARELHDSVSQALFGIVLGLRTALQYMESKIDPKSTVQYALALAESGLSDIRALIFELRPEQLEKEGLVTALQKQVQAMSVRYKLDVTVNVPPEEPPLPLPAKEALYRIGMEALQNTMKHAQATKVQVNLHTEPNVWTLDIQDNGRGFDPNTIYEGHYGLNTMRERADQLGATLNIISAPGAGARVSVQVPMSPSN